MNGDLSNPRPEVVAEVLHRAGSPGYDDWWTKVTDSGCCAAPIRLAKGSTLRPIEIFARCKNRRASVCPSCSQLYAGDTWQLVHAGISATDDPSARSQPMIFVTLTAPSFGTVHSDGFRPLNQANRRCQPIERTGWCRHGRPMDCADVHWADDPLLGEPLCPECYDYPAHVLFSWHAPELWHRFTVRLRRLLAAACQVKGEHPSHHQLAYVKVAEMQRRGVPHFHAVIRLDSESASSGPEPVEFATLVRQAGLQVALSVTAQQRCLTLRFGEQVDIRMLDGPSGRAVAAYLAKYVTKSVGDFGVNARRLHEAVIDELDVSDHVRRLLQTIADLAREPQRARLGAWLHTLGYRGHVTTKTRRYSTTMGELRAKRDAWRRTQNPPPDEVESHDPTDDEWRYLGCGHANQGEQFLAVSAAERTREMRRIAREELAGIFQL